jgi:hypothetical protein
MRGSRHDAHDRLRKGRGSIIEEFIMSVRLRALSTAALLALALAGCASQPGTTVASHPAATP